MQQLPQIFTKRKYPKSSAWKSANRKAEEIAAVEQIVKELEQSAYDVTPNEIDLAKYVRDNMPKMTVDEMVYAQIELAAAICPMEKPKKSKQPNEIRRKQNQVAKERKRRDVGKKARKRNRK